MRLKDKPKATAQTDQQGFLRIVQFMAKHTDGTILHFPKATDQRQQSRFPRPGWPHQNGQAALFYFKIDIKDCLLAGLAGSEEMVQPPRCYWCIAHQNKSAGSALASLRVAIAPERLHATRVPRKTSIARLASISTGKPVKDTSPA